MSIGTSQKPWHQQGFTRLARERLQLIRVKRQLDILVHYLGWKSSPALGRRAARQERANLALKAASRGARKSDLRKSKSAHRRARQVEAMVGTQPLHYTRTLFQRKKRKKEKKGITKEGSSDEDCLMMSYVWLVKPFPVQYSG